MPIGLLALAFWHLCAWSVWEVVAIRGFDWGVHLLRNDPRFRPAARHPILENTGRSDALWPQLVLFWDGAKAKQNLAAGMVLSVRKSEKPRHGQRDTKSRFRGANTALPVPHILSTQVRLSSCDVVPLNDESIMLRTGKFSPWFDVTPNMIFCETADGMN